MRTLYKNTRKYASVLKKLYYVRKPKEIFEHERDVEARLL